nr:hypothetical protein GCM10020185_10380 [Pseudomonas brassicacearum subsp. brassicacearum]
MTVLDVVMPGRLLQDPGVRVAAIVQVPLQGIELVRVIGKGRRVAGYQRLVQMGDAVHAPGFDQSQDQVQLKRRGHLRVVTSNLQRQLATDQPVVGHSQWQAQEVVEVDARPEDRLRAMI